MPTKSTPISKTAFGTAYDSVANGGAGSTTPNNWTREWTNVRTDDGPVRSYKQKISNVQDATTNLTGSSQVYEFSTGYIRVVYRRNPGVSSALPEKVERSISGDLCQSTFPTVGSPDVTEADYRAKQKFANRAFEAQTALQGGVVLGEIGETLRMLKSPAKALRSGIDDYIGTVKRNKKRQRGKRGGYIGDTWLEYSFGWTPFIKDIEAASVALDRIKLRLFETMSVKAGESAKFEGGFSSSIKGYHPASTYIAIHQFSESIVIYRGAIKVPIGDRILMSRQNLGFTWNNFIPTVWELIPYSFLVDYFTNVGDVLNSWAAWSLDWGWLNKTIVTRRVRENTETGIYNVPAIANYTIESVNSEPGSSVTETRTVSRSPLSPVNIISSLRFEIPGMSSPKWLNIAALASSRNRIL